MFPHLESTLSLLCSFSGKLNDYEAKIPSDRLRCSEYSVLSQSYHPQPPGLSARREYTSTHPQSVTGQLVPCVKKAKTLPESPLEILIDQLKH